MEKLHANWEEKDHPIRKIYIKINSKKKNPAGTRKGYVKWYPCCSLHENAQYLHRKRNTTYREGRWTGIGPPTFRYSSYGRYDHIWTVGSPHLPSRTPPSKWSMYSPHDPHFHHCCTSASLQILSPEAGIMPRDSSSPHAADQTCWKRGGALLFLSELSWLVGMVSRGKYRTQWWRCQNEIEKPRGNSFCTL